MSLKPTKDREIKIDSRTGIFHYRGTPVRGGKEIIRSLGVRTFGSAMLQKKDLLLRLRGIDPRAKEVLFVDAVKVFLEERKRKAKKTYEMAVYACKNLLPYFESYTLRQVTRTTWEEYKSYQAQIKPNRHLRYDKRHLLMILLRAKKKGLITEIPELDLQDEGHERKRTLDSKEIAAILNEASPTMHGLALFVYKMGARPGEVLGAPWIEFDLERGLWAIPAKRTKTRTARTIKLNGAVWEWLTARKKTSKSEWVFPTRENASTPIHRYNKQWKRLMAQCGLSEDITPYYLRHTFLTECAKKIRQGELSLVTVVKYAGTSIEQLEKTYLHIEGEDTKAVADLMDGPSDI